MTHSRVLLSLLLTASVLLMNSAQAVAVPAPAPIGYVKTVSGDASVGTQGKSVKADVGVPIYIGSRLKTGANSSLGVTLKDNTVMSFGPDTELTVDEFVFAPAKGDLKLGASMIRGTLNFISGVIARLKPGAEVVKTPTATIGIRGTHFLVKLED